MIKTQLRNVIYTFLSKIDRLMSAKNPITVLCYHSISNDSFRYSISVDEFKKQVDYMCANYKSITIDDLEKYLEQKLIINEPSFLITFDDGYANVMGIQDYLTEKGIKPVIFLLPTNAKPNYSELGQKFTRLTNQQIKALINTGWSIGSHSYTHADFYKLDDVTTNYEVKESKSELTKEFDIPIRFFSYPKGRYNKKIETSINKSGYSLAFTMDDGTITQKTNKLRIPRIGVDQTHTYAMFLATISPLCIKFRQMVKAFGITGV